MLKYSAHLSYERLKWDFQTWSAVQFDISTHDVNKTRTHTKLFPGSALHPAQRTNEWRETSKRVVIGWIRAASSVPPMRLLRTKDTVTFKLPLLKKNTTRLDLNEATL